jgi:S1-C subfamily serine protease
VNPYRYEPSHSEQPQPAEPAPAEPATSQPPPESGTKPARGWRIGGTAALVLALLAGAAGGGIAGTVAAARLSAQPTPAPTIAIKPNDQPGAPSIGQPSSPSSSPQQGEESSVAGAVYEKVNRAVVQVVNGQGSGSGFVVDKSGLILTNNHVVEGADSVQVLFSDGTQRKGQVLGTDSGNDLAILKVDLPEGVEPVALADSDHVKVGATAIAIGSPFGLDQTVTQGIISAVHRDWQPGDGSVKRNLIQTDTPINPGNSGGPLLNAQGEVIGINTMIESPVRGSVGVGFAIPINTAKQLLPKLASGARIEPTWLGISGQSIDAEFAQQQGLSVQSGVLVGDIVAGGPADEAGLQPGDVITAVDGKALDSMDALAATVSSHVPGDALTLTVTRGGQSGQLTVELQGRPQQNP